jgi:hypothetical protein
LISAKPEGVEDLSFLKTEPPLDSDLPFADSGDLVLATSILFMRPLAWCETEFFPDLSFVVFIF